MCTHAVFIDAGVVEGKKEKQEHEDSHNGHYWEHSSPPPRCVTTLNERVRIKRERASSCKRDTRLEVKFKVRIRSPDDE